MVKIIVDNNIPSYQLLSRKYSRTHETRVGSTPYRVIYQEISLIFSRGFRHRQRDTKSTTGRACACFTQL